MEDKLKRATLLIEHYLNQIFGSIRVYREDREFLVPWGSTVINVDLIEEGEDVLVHIYSPVALRVKQDKELLRFLLIENASIKMASFYIELEKGFLDILVGSKVKLDFINKELLGYLSMEVGTIANEYSKEIIAVFGGLSFKEYVEREKLEKKPFEKVLHDTFAVEGLNLSLEIYRSSQDTFMILGKIVDTGQVFIRAERRKSLQDMFKLSESIKECLLKREVKALKKLLKHFEVEEFFLYNVLAGKDKDKIKKLKEIEREIQFLTDMLMKGEISREEYKKRISDIEKSLDL